MSAVMLLSSYCILAGALGLSTIDIREIESRQGALDISAPNKSMPKYEYAELALVNNGDIALAEFPLLKDNVSHSFEVATTLNRNTAKRLDTIKTMDVEKKGLFHVVPFTEWFVLLVTCAVLITVDLKFISPRRHTDGFWHCLIAVSFWVISAFAYNVYYGIRFGIEEGRGWSSGYVWEYLLSLDNLFVFHLIFSRLRLPKEFVPKALTLGTCGQVGLRMLSYWWVDNLGNAVMLVQFVIGLILVFSGVTFAFEDDDGDEDVQNARVVTFTKWMLGRRLKGGYDSEGNCLVVEDGVAKVTLLFLVILCVEVSDVVFALDSVSAKISQTENVYTAFCSTVLAFLGLRTLYYFLECLVGYFEMLKYGIAAVLVFMGIELCVSLVVNFSPVVVFTIIMNLLAVSILTSSMLRLCSSSTEEGDSKIAQDKTAFAYFIVPEVTEVRGGSED